MPAPTPSGTGPDLALGLHHLACRAAAGNPYDRAVLDHLQDLQRQLAELRARVPQCGPCSPQGGCACPPDPEEGCEPAEEPVVDVVCDLGAGWQIERITVTDRRQDLE